MTGNALVKYPLGWDADVHIVGFTWWLSLLLVKLKSLRCLAGCLSFHSYFFFYSFFYLSWQSELCEFRAVIYFSTKHKKNKWASAVMATVQRRGRNTGAMNKQIDRITIRIAIGMFSIKSFCCWFQNNRKTHIIILSIDDVDNDNDQQIYLDECTKKERFNHYFSRSLFLCTTFKSIPSIYRKYKSILCVDNLFRFIWATRFSRATFRFIASGFGSKTYFMHLFGFA